jgi:hypothetical protein
VTDTKSVLGVGTQNIIVQGRKGYQCTLNLQTLVLGLSIPPLIVPESLEGCPAGSAVIVGADYDSCGPFTSFWKSESLWIRIMSVVVISIAGIGALVFLILAVIRQRLYRRRAYVEIGESALTVTLQGMSMYTRVP